MSDRLDQAIRERFNALAAHCDRLEKANADLAKAAEAREYRIDDCDRRITSYVADLRALTQLAADVGIPDAESTGHSTLVVQLREKFKANQEAADVLRLFLQYSDSAADAVISWGKRNGITLPAKDETISAASTKWSPAQQAAMDDEQAEWKACKEAENARKNQVPDAGKMVPPEPAAESGEAKSGYSLARLYAGGQWAVMRNDCGELRVSFAVFNAAEEATAREYLEFLRGTSPVHQQLEEAREENGDLRRDREAWDAVRKHDVCINLVCKQMWSAWSHLKTGGINTDPREAVLSLAKTLEDGK